MKNISKLLKIVALLLVVLVIAFGVYYYTMKKPNVEVDSKPISYVYLWNNEDFKKGETLTIEGKYDEALDAYNRLLQSDLSKEDAITKSQLNIRIATLLDVMGEKQNAVDSLNKIATNSKEYFITRAFAYEYMARMVYETRDPEVLKAVTAVTGVTTTSKDPYQAVSLDLLKKSEEIAPLYLTLTQKMKIELHAVQAKYTKENTATYRYDLGLIDRMIKDIQDEQNKGYMLPLALLRKAQLAEIIDASGNYGLPKTVEDYYKDAQKAYDMYPEARSYNYVYYEYARYLANKFGDSRKADIVTLMAHYGENVPEKNNLRTLLKNTSADTKQATQVEILKKIHPFSI